MTYIDSVLDVSDYFKRALQYGHKALALTDKNSVQGLGEFEHLYNELPNFIISSITILQYLLISF